MTYRNIIILSFCQALGLAGVSAVVLLGGLVGTDLAPTEALATLPVALLVVGTAISAVPAALLMRRVGRRAGFVFAALVASVAGFTAAAAVIAANFLLFCAAALLVGVNAAFIQQYRFAASESVAPIYVGRAVSLVLLGGIIAGYFGPELARSLSDALPAALYSGSFVGVGVLYAVAAVLLLFIRDVEPPDPREMGGERPLRAVVRQPLFQVAVLAAAVAYGVMTFIMTATPIHLHEMQGHTLGATTTVIQSHIIAMYLPSLFSGFIVERLGLPRMLLAGALVMVTSVLVSLFGVGITAFWAALVLLGVGWNLLFVGATVLLTRTYTTGERFRAQAVNDFSIFGVRAVASLFAGTILFLAGWQVLSFIALPPLLLMLALLLWRRRRIAHAPVPAPVTPLPAAGDGD
ncbi:MAG: MFS transporter [Candidatus Promineifilaceae bacterium]|nr:MFS transporter [Candidatus Promineifilaceae bacterium]